MRQLILFFVLVITTALTACTNHQYLTPRPDTHALDPLPQEFKSDGPISLINSQSDASDHIFLSSGAARFHANYQAWTDVAIEILARELTARGSHVSDGQQRSIQLAVIAAHSEVGFVKTETQITVKATLSNGYTSTYTGMNNNVMGAVNQRQIDGALMRAVAALLSDAKVVAFLKGQ